MSCVSCFRIARMASMNMTYLICMMLLGLAVHFIKVMMTIMKDGQPITPIAYWKDYPYQSALSLIGAVVGFVALKETGNLSLITAFGVGYMANSVADILGSRTQGKLA